MPVRVAYLYRIFIHIGGLHTWGLTPISDPLTPDNGGTGGRAFGAALTPTPLPGGEGLCLVVLRWLWRVGGASDSDPLLRK